MTTTTEELAAVLAQLEVAEELAAHAAHALAEAEELAEEDPAATAEVGRCRTALAVVEKRLDELRRRRRELGG